MTKQKNISKAYWLSFLLTTGLLYSDFTNAEQQTEYSFNSGFLIGSKNSIDLNRFNINPISAGIYSFDVYTNDNWQGRYELNIVENQDGALGLCYTEKMLFDFGVIASKLNKILSEDKSFCGPLSEWLNDINIYDQFNFSTFQLNLFFPQIYIQQQERGYVSPELWQKGIPSLNLGYSTNYYYTHESKRNQNDSAFYLGVNSGLSFDGWLLKYLGNMSWHSSQSIDWNNRQIYLERPLINIKSKLTAGQFYTEGSLFDSINLQGIRLATDSNMYPDSMTNYAPEIRGVAQSNALVTVRQNDTVIYQTSVPPGPFNLIDVNPIGYGYDLQVTVREADGSETYFMVPYSSLPILLRPGFTQYQLSVGKVDISGITNEPYLIQGSIQHGLNNTFTVFGGTTLFNDYQAVIVGTGVNTMLGAFALDATYSRTSFTDHIATGRSYRLTFSQLLTPTKTNIMLAAYRYSTKDYFGINDAVYAIDYDKRNLPDYRSKEKNGFSVMLNQPLAEGWGGFHFNGRIANYWGKEGKNKQYQLSYNNGYKRFSYTLSATRVYRQFNSKNDRDDRISFNFTMPLSFGEKRVTLHSYSLFNNTDFSSTQTGVSGAFDDDYNWTYGINTSIPKKGKASLSLNTSYSNSMSVMTGSYSLNDNYHQLSAGMSGGMVLHSDGLTFTHNHANTMVLIEAKDAAGAKVDSDRFSKIDRNGYALDNSVRAYRMNHVGVDPLGSPEDIVFTSTSAMVIPYENSIVKLKLDTRKEKSYVFNVTRADGEPLPFGSNVTDQGRTIGIVGQGGTVFLYDISTKNADIEWKEGGCHFDIPTDQQHVICY